MSKKVISKTHAVVLDIDDTIVDFIGFLCYLYNVKHNTTVSPVDLKNWDMVGTKVEDAQGKIVKGEELRVFFRDLEPHGLYAAIPAIKESVLAVELMRRLGYKIILLTARDEKFLKDSEINLIVNRIPYDEIIFDHDKAKQINRLAKKHSIAMFVDDNTKHVTNVFDTDKVEVVYLVNRPHNNSTELPEGIVRINDLLEIVRTLPEVESNAVLRLRK